MPRDTAPVLTTRAAMRPTTLDMENRTVDIVISTGADVERMDLDGRHVARLAITPNAVDLSRLPVPVLNGHRQDGVESVLGTLENVRFETGAMVGTIRFSARHDDLMADIESGVIRSVSIGYTVETFEETDESGVRVRLVIRWMLMEVSFVPVPADPYASTRSHPMSATTTAPEATTAPPQAPLQTRAQVNTEIRALAATFDLPDSFANDLVDREATVEQARAAAIEAFAARTTAGPRVTTMHQIDSPEAIISRMGEAQFARANPDHQLSDPARPYANLTVVDVARDCLTRAGTATTSLSTNDILQRALHTTSKFPGHLRRHRQSCVAGGVRSRTCDSAKRRSPDDRSRFPCEDLYPVGRTTHPRESDGEWRVHIRHDRGGQRVLRYRHLWKDHRFQPEDDGQR